MSEISKCPKCGGEYVYFDGSLYVCPDCANEFNEEDASATETIEVAKDSNGAELLDGDSVTVTAAKAKSVSVALKENAGQNGLQINGSASENNLLQHFLQLTLLNNEFLITGQRRHSREQISAHTENFKFCGACGNGSYEVGIADDIHFTLR